MLRDDGTGDILDQYVRFCKIADEQREKHGLTQEAIEETFRVCMEENILAPFLASRQKEVQEIMVTLFDQEKIAEIHDYNVEQRGIQKGIQKERQEGQEDGIRVMVDFMRRQSMAQDAAVRELVEQFGLLPQTAEEKVRKYWKQ